MRPQLKLLSPATTRDAGSAARPRPTLASLLAHSSARATHGASSDDANPSSEDDVIDVNEAARMLRVGRNKVYEMVARNEIPHRRFGRRIRFSRTAIVRWLDSWSPRIAKEGQ